MKTNFSHANKYNNLGRSFFNANSTNKDAILDKLKLHPERGELLAHLVNFKMYRTTAYKGIAEQDAELIYIERIMNAYDSKITFDQVQLFVRNRSILFQRQLPSHFKQAILDLIDCGGSEYKKFLDNLAFNSENFLAENGIYPAGINPVDLIKKLDVWVNEAPTLERKSRLGAKSKILNAYKEKSRSLNLEGYNLTTLPTGVFKGLIELRELNLYNNHLTTLPVNIFNGLTNLKFLNLPKNNLITLPAYIFSDLTNLKTVRLSDNQLTTLPEGIFNGLTNLKTVDLSDNQLTTLSDGIFNGLINLKTLNLSKNQLTSLPDGIPNKLANLRKINLKHNRFNFSNIDFREEVRGIKDKNAIILLGKFGNQLEIGTRNALVKTLIKNYSVIKPEGYVRYADKALELLDKYASQLDDETFKNLVKTLIENCSNSSSNSGINPYMRVRNASKAIKALEKYRFQLDDTFFKSLVKTLIENCSDDTTYGSYALTSKAIKALNNNKEWLIVENYGFYQQTVNRIFNYCANAHIHVLLWNHGEVIDPDTIRNRYNSEDSISTVQEIRDYVQGPGQHRCINLPPRLDMIVNDRPLAGIAFEVHKFTDGVESIALEAINKFLIAVEAPNPKFTIDNLRDKFSLIENEQSRAKANNALDRILGSSNYKARLESVLPIITAFLNLHHTIWETDYQDLERYGKNLTDDQKIDLLRELRWTMWLTQSFVEAGTAYDSGSDSTSCVKGVYERLFMALEQCIL
jgi:Leucine-rich repeat (LRR) protein